MRGLFDGLWGRGCGPGCGPVFGPYLSAYDIARKHGYEGTETEWLRSLASWKVIQARRSGNTFECDAVLSDVFALLEHGTIPLLLVDACELAFPSQGGLDYIGFTTLPRRSGAQDVYTVYQMNRRGNTVVDYAASGEGDIDWNPGEGAVTYMMLAEALRTSLDLADSAVQPEEMAAEIAAAMAGVEPGEIILPDTYTNITNDFTDSGMTANSFITYLGTNSQAGKFTFTASGSVYYIDAELSGLNRTLKVLRISANGNRRLEYFYNAVSCGGFEMDASAHTLTPIGGYPSGEGGETSGNSALVLVKLRYYGGDDVATMNAAQIAAAMADADVHVVLVDRAGRHCNLMEPPDLSAETVTAKFSTLDENGDQIIYTVYGNGVTTSETVDRSVLPTPTAQQLGYVPVAGPDGIIWTTMSASQGSDGLSAEVKSWLLLLAQHVLYEGPVDGPAIVAGLTDALYPSEPEKVLESISASYVQGNTVVTPDTPLDALKAGLTVTATYDDESTAPVNAYTLSGTLTAGTCTITVSYGGQTDTFTVTVTQITLTGISAVYTQGQNVVTPETPLNDLKAGLVVTASYSDSSTQTLSASAYTLSGTLTAGTSTVTVSYGGQTATFTVTVTAAQKTLIHNWDFTQSLVDSVGNVEAEAGTGNTNGSAPSRDANGIHFTEGRQYVTFGPMSLAGKTIEIDIADIDFKGNSDYGFNLLGHYHPDNGAYRPGPLLFGYVINGFTTPDGWSSFGYTAASGTTRGMGSGWGDLNDADEINAFANTTVKLVVDSDGHTARLYVDDVLIATDDTIYYNRADHILTLGGGFVSSNVTRGDQLYDCDITAVRIYSNGGAV